jgi:tetratricopeptide (TPR) repeat protein
VFGHFLNGFGHWAVGDLKLSQKSHEKAIEVALDPSYAQFSKGPLGLTYLRGGQLQEAENVLQSCINFCKKRDIGYFSVVCQYFLAPILIAKGQMQQGIKLLEKAQETLIRNQRRAHYALSEYILGEVNSQIATGPKPSLSIMAKNIGFLVRNVPFAAKKAEEHFNKAIEIYKEIGAKGFLGQVYLSQGLLFKASKRPDQAKQCILEAINIFQECEAGGWLKQANEALDSLG